MFPSTQLVETIPPGKCLHSPTLGTRPDLLIISYESSSDYQSFRQQTTLPLPLLVYLYNYTWVLQKLGFLPSKNIHSLLSRSHCKQAFLLIGKGHLYCPSYVSIMPVYS